MFTIIRELFSLLTSKQRKQFYVLQLLVVLMSFAEIVGVVSIAPFMALVSDTSILNDDNLLSKVFFWSGLETANSFVFWLGMGVLILLAISSGISMFTVWRLSLFAYKTGVEMADRLYQYYMQQNWLYHASGSSAQYTKNIANETDRITSLILLPLVQMNARLVLAITMSAAVFVYDPKVAIVALLGFTVSYFLLFVSVRKRLQKNGEVISDVLSFRYQTMNEGFGGIKDLLLLGRSKHLINRFKKTGDSFALALGTNITLSLAPRYFMELIAFGSMIALVLYLVVSQNHGLGLVLPVLSVYALAGFKLLPAFQQIYSSMAQIRGNISAFESMRVELHLSQKTSERIISQEDHNNILSLNEYIELSNVSFKYPNQKKHVLKDFYMKIDANSVVGIVGSTGSGKSTVIDIVMGLIDPKCGSLLVDGVPITKKNKRAWQNNIGFVPQSIFLSEGNIAENVAFGIEKKLIDYDKVLEALRMSHLKEFVESLPKGLDTKVGERGVQLSGGQGQRIGIARALYSNANVLVFDEATSALDGVTEKMIMEAIHDFHDSKTIILIAHRLKTIKKCNHIFMIDNGKVVDQGSYQEIIKKNKKFRSMATYA